MFFSGSHPRSLNEPRGSTVVPRMAGIGALLSCPQVNDLRATLICAASVGLALGHLLKGLETASSVAQACGVEAPLLAACRDTWAAAETRLGSEADQSALIRWSETLVPPAPRT
jgi:hypothetical protein